MLIKITAKMATACPFTPVNINVIKVICHLVAFKFQILVCIDLISLLDKFKYRFYIVPTTQICVQ